MTEAAASLPLAHDPDSPLALVLSGGGARGAFQVGVWEVLSSHPKGTKKLPLVVSGTSAGALNGALLAAGLGPSEMLQFWLKLAESPPVVANERFFASVRRVLRNVAMHEPFRAWYKRNREGRIAAQLFRKHRWYRTNGMTAMVLEFLLTARFDTVSRLLDGIDTGYLFDTSPIRTHLRAAIGADAIRNSQVRLAINTVDINTGRVVRIVNHRPEKHKESSSKHYVYEPVITLDMILASASIPLLFRPMSVAGRWLWDGGLLVNSPMAPAVALGARRIVPVLVTTGKNAETDPMGNFGQSVERCVDAFLENAYRVDRKFLLARNRYAEKLPEDNLHVIDLYEPVRPASSKLFNAGSYLYFEKKALLAMYEAGRSAGRRWLERGPVLDRRSMDD